MRALDEVLINKQAKRPRFLNWDLSPVPGGNAVPVTTGETVGIYSNGIVIDGDDYQVVSIANEIAYGLQRFGGTDIPSSGKFWFGFKPKPVIGSVLVAHNYCLIGDSASIAAMTNPSAPDPTVLIVIGYNASLGLFYQNAASPSSTPIVVDPTYVEGTTAVIGIDRITGDITIVTPSVLVTYPNLITDFTDVSVYGACVAYATVNGSIVSATMTTSSIKTNGLEEQLIGYTPYPGLGGAALNPEAVNGDTLIAINTGSFEGVDYGIGEGCVVVDVVTKKVIPQLRTDIGLSLLSELVAGVPAQITEVESLVDSKLSKVPVVVDLIGTGVLDLPSTYDGLGDNGYPNTLYTYWNNEDDLHFGTARLNLNYHLGNDFLYALPVTATITEGSTQYEYVCEIELGVGDNWGCPRFVLSSIDGLKCFSGDHPEGIVVDPGLIFNNVTPAKFAILVDLDITEIDDTTITAYSTVSVKTANGVFPVANWKSGAAYWHKQPVVKLQATSAVENSDYARLDVTFRQSDLDFGAETNFPYIRQNQVIPTGAIGTLLTFKNNGRYGSLGMPTDIDRYTDIVECKHDDTAIVLNAPLSGLGSGNKKKARFLNNRQLMELDDRLTQAVASTITLIEIQLYDGNDPVDGYKPGILYKGDATDRTVPISSGTYPPGKYYFQQTDLGKWIIDAGPSDHAIFRTNVHTDIIVVLKLNSGKCYFECLSNPYEEYVNGGGVLDLDDIYGIGFNYLIYTDPAYSGNYPSDVIVSQFSQLEIVPYVTPGGMQGAGYCQQIFTNRNDRFIYDRFRDGTSNTWTPWVKRVTRAELEALDARITALENP